MNDIDRRHLIIQRSGKRALRDYKVPIFTGFNPAFQNRFGVAMMFTPHSVEEVQQRFLQEVDTIPDMQFFLANRDIHIHATVLEGLYEGTDPDLRDQLFSELAADPILRARVQEMPEFLCFDRLLLDKQNLLLVARDIPSSLVRVREGLAELYIQKGLKPLSLNHLLHITLARMTVIPPPGVGFQPYMRKMMILKRSLLHHPLHLARDAFFIGNVYEFLSRQPT